MQANPSSALTPAPPPAIGGQVSAQRRTVGRALIAAASVGAGALLLVQIGATAGWTGGGFATWRPVALAFVVWAVALCVGVILTRGTGGQQAVFLLPAVLLTLAFVIFPTIFGLYIAFTDWNLSAAGGRQFNGLDNFRRLVDDGGYWEAVRNMGVFVGAVLVQYAIGFGLALLLNQDIRFRKLFRVIFLLPFMLSPVAISFMIGKSIFDSQYGPMVQLLELVGFENVSFFENPWLARLNIALMDAWYSIPFVMVLLLAGLQALPHEVVESAKVDGATGWQSFRDITFPLMLPVSLTAVVLRMIFEFKLIDVVRVVTGGGPGGATDTVTNFIYREGIEKTNVGYATALSQVYLVGVIVFVSVLLALASRWMRRLT